MPQTYLRLAAGAGKKEDIKEILILNISKTNRAFLDEIKSIFNSYQRALS